MKPASSILFTWEIGQGFGHVLPMLPMAREFKAQGHRVTFALRDVCGAGAMLQVEGFAVLQAPFHPDQFFPADGPQPQSMADILAIFGFTSRQHLAGMAAAWSGIFQLCQPDLLVASYAPLSLLSARQHGVPSILMALPFELPVDAHPSPDWRGGQRAQVFDAQVIDTVNAVFDKAQVSRVHGIFAAQQTHVMSFAELDFFGPRQGVSYCGAFFVADAGISPQWPAAHAGHGGKVFAYLNAELPHLDALRQAIQASPLRYCIAMRDASPALLQAWRAPNVWITEQMLRLDEALPQCDVMLGYGSAGLVHASLLAGKPMVSYVRHYEAMLCAQQAVRLGAGLMPQPQTPQHITQALIQVVQEPSFAQAAQQFARRYAGYSPSQASQNIAAQALSSSRSL
jgi:hypothetical protein